ncbi:MarR family winged helix-turn-helix transcriptional regulator [Pedobacter alpinus]|uniref:MarR family winged helix-turn-helix transcriptional regulator n=1 Tax=Pedobacter alpinus TaxID=1590643 RepID=A0ABW5TRW2_9SPHI
MKKQEEPLIHPLIQITKKYLGAFADVTQHIPLERYHYVLVLILENNQTLTQKDLANYLLVDKSFMVNMIDYLTKNGFVFRETDKEDRRKHLIKLTQKAFDYIPEINKAIKEINDLALNGISETQRIIFTEVLEKIEQNFNINITHTISFDYKKSEN